MPSTDSSQHDFGVVTCRRAGRVVWRVQSFVIDKTRPTVLPLPSGCGRSALIEHLAGFRSESSSFDFGFEPSHNEMAGAELWPVGVVPQHFEQMLSENTVSDEIITAFENACLSQGDAELARDGVLARFNLLPLRTANPRTLSGGEMQRVALALALSITPALLLLDDPFDEFDSASVREIINLLVRYSVDERRGCLVVSEKVPENLRSASRVLAPDVLLANGRASASSGSGRGPADKTKPGSNRGEAALRWTDPGGKRTHSSAPERIALSQVHLWYPGKSNPALDGISAEFAGGETVHIEGPNGAGKSTLFAVLQGFERPQRGAISINGVSASRGAFRRLRRRMGVLNQTYRQFFFEDTVASELQAVLRLRARRSTDAAAVSAGSETPSLGDWLDRFDLTCSADTVVDELSMNDRRMLGFACAVCLADQVLFLDEPTAGVGSATVARMLAVLRETASRDRLVLIISHDREFASAIATRHILLRRGAIVKDERLEV